MGAWSAAMGLNAIGDGYKKATCRVRHHDVRSDAASKITDSGVYLCCGD